MVTTLVQNNPAVSLSLSVERGGPPMIPAIMTFGPWFGWRSYRKPHRQDHSSTWWQSRTPSGHSPRRWRNRGDTGSSTKRGRTPWWRSCNPRRARSRFRTTGSTACSRDLYRTRSTSGRTSTRSPWSGRHPARRGHPRSTPETREHVQPVKTCTDLSFCPNHTM